MHFQTPTRLSGTTLSPRPDAFDSNPTWEDSKSFDFQVESTVSQAVLVTGSFSSPQLPQPTH